MWGGGGGGAARTRSLTSSGVRGGVAPARTSGGSRCTRRAYSTTLNRFPKRHSSMTMASVTPCARARMCRVEVGTARLSHARQGGSPDVGAQRRAHGGREPD